MSSTRRDKTRPVSNECESADPLGDVMAWRVLLHLLRKALEGRWIVECPDDISDVLRAFWTGVARGDDSSRLAVSVTRAAGCEDADAIAAAAEAINRVLAVRELALSVRRELDVAGYTSALVAIDLSFDETEPGPVSVAVDTGGERLRAIRPLDLSERDVWDVARERDQGRRTIIARDVTSREAVTIVCQEVDASGNDLIHVAPAQETRDG